MCIENHLIARRCISSSDETNEEEEEEEEDEAEKEYMWNSCIDFISSAIDESRLFGDLFFFLSVWLSECLNV